VTFSPKADVVVCLSTPPFVALLGLIARIKGSRFVYKAEDLYPDVAIALSTLHEQSLLTRLLARVLHFLLRKADWVVTLDDAMTQRLKDGGARCVSTIPNWADGNAIRPDPLAGERFRQAHNLKEKFVILYSGNLGLAHRFDAVIEAAKRCVVEIPEVVFLFVGNGSRWNEVRKASNGLDNVRFMQYQPREKLNELYNAADLHLVTLRDEVAGLLFPSKYPAALAAGKPVLLVGGSGAPLQQEIRRKSLGWVCPHWGPVVANAIRNAWTNRDQREAMGKNARHIFETRYSMAIVMRQWEQVLNSVVMNKVVVEGRDADLRSGKSAASASGI
jgi:glycosyltransferase involved in cell wall biosynthesis